MKNHINIICFYIYCDKFGSLIVVYIHTPLQWLQAFFISTNLQISVFVNHFKYTDFFTFYQVFFTNSKNFLHCLTHNFSLLLIASSSASSKHFNHFYDIKSYVISFFSIRYNTFLNIFFNVFQYVTIPFSIHLAAYVANFTPLSPL